MRDKKSTTGEVNHAFRCSRPRSHLDGGRRGGRSDHPNLRHRLHDDELRDGGEPAHLRHAASGNENQTVATTNANAATPAHGHNSFTRGEARRRIAAEGYSHVTGLRLAKGVWQGHATKDGQTANVWLDYKGNVGTSQS